MCNSSFHGPVSSQWLKKAFAVYQHLWPERYKMCCPSYVQMRHWTHWQKRTTSLPCIRKLFLASGYILPRHGGKSRGFGTRKNWAQELALRFTKLVTLCRLIYVNYVLWVFPIVTWVWYLPHEIAMSDKRTYGKQEEGLGTRWAPDTC